MVYELISGHPPFEHEEPLVIVTRHLTKQPTPLREIMDGVPAHVDEAVMRALAKDPAARFPSMEAFAQAMAGHDTPVSSGVAAPLSAERPDADALPDIRGYLIDRLLGSGRLGSQVYLAHHAAMQTPVAIRVLMRTRVADWETSRDRFLREARAMQVVHPSVLQVRDIGETPDFLYVVTDYIEGDSLAERLDAEGPLPWADLQRFTAQLVDAVTVLHRRGSWICGVSPYTTRLLHDAEGDRLLVSSGGISQVRDLLGTMGGTAIRGDEIRRSELPYVAPEVLMGDQPSASADLFTVGALVYHMATGTAPFGEASLPELMGAMLRKRPEPLAAIRPEIPQAFSDAIMRTLSPVSDERPADARALGMAI